MTTLEGAPSTVSGSFLCNWNRLTSLEGAPSTVGGSFECSRNDLTTLEGAPSTVGGGFDCSFNQLTTLDGAPSTVGGGFECSRNRLMSLEGAPNVLIGGFYCNTNPINFIVNDFSYDQLLKFNKSGVIIDSTSVDYSKLLEFYQSEGINKKGNIQELERAGYTVVDSVIGLLFKEFW